MMSEKPSDTSTSLERPPTLLLDENLSSSDIAQVLRKFPLEWGIELHTDHFPRGLSDVEVIQGCADRQWSLISCDDRIRYVPQNKAAVLRCRVRAFMFGKGNYQGVEYAAALVVGRAHIVNAIRRSSGHLLARIQRDGDVQILEPKAPTGELTARQKTQIKFGNVFAGE
jgi:hypothetical protein